MPLSSPTRKTQALLAFLALPPGRWHPRERLASLLWGGMAESQARRGLRQSLFMLRKALGVDPPAVLIAGEAVTLDPSSADVDVVQFERLVAEGTPAALHRAVDLYHGELLEGLGLQEAPFEEWLLGERDRLRELALEALARLLQYQRTAGDTEAALQTALRLLALDPLQEPVHRAVMRLYVELGRRPSALRQYQNCVGILQRELDVEPEPRTKQLYREILRQRSAHSAVRDTGTPWRSPAADAPTASDQTPPRELPLIGREADMARLRAVLERAWSGRGQLVALIGEAGVGKSRLVAELAAEATAHGGRVLVGRCYEAEQMLPFAPWVDAFRAGHVEADGDVVDDLDAPSRAELARLLPGLRLPGQGSGHTPVDDRRLFESVTELIRLLLRRQPALLVLEDLHWGDEMSLRLLSFLARRLHTWPLLVMATARDEDLAAAPIPRRTFEDLTQGEDVLELRIAPLSREDTHALVRALARANQAAVTAGLAERVWQISEGNPFAIVETMCAAPAGLADVPSAALPVPKRVRTVILRHLESLSPRGDPALLLQGHHALWPVLVWQGQVEAARQHLEYGLALYDRAQHRSHAFIYGGHDPGVCCWKVASWAWWILGSPDRGLEASVASLALARELDHPASMIVALAWACVLRDLRREPREMEACARALDALSAEHEASQWRAMGEIMEGAAHAELGDGNRAIDQIGRGLAAYRSTGAHLFVPYFLSLLARAHLKRGRPRDGLRVIEEALVTARATGERVWEAELVRVDGELRLAASVVDAAEAAACFRRAKGIARRQAARSWELRAVLSLAGLAGDGSAEEARRGLAEVYAGFTDGFDTADLRDAAAVLEHGSTAPARR